MRKEIFNIFLFGLAEIIYLFAGHVFWFKIWGQLALVSFIFQVWSLVFFPYEKVFPLTIGKQILGSKNARNRRF